MAFRNDEWSTPVKFATFPQMPSLIYRACVEKGIPSNTRYIQEAVCEKLARDGIEPLDSLLAKLPPCRSNSAALFNGKGNAVKRKRVRTKK